MKKKTGLFVAAAVILCAGMFAFRSDEDQERASIVMVRAIIIPNGNLSTIEIYRGDTRVEEIKLPNLRADSQQLNWQTITSTLNKIRNEGYNLVSFTTNGETRVMSTYVFSK
ncbi:MAG TPA: hypothetical protein VG737_08600 [Cyclobacteriaceae bacterium]|nr:hypothetical protein [Cyclobacteriaceae bacterium]